MGLNMVKELKKHRKEHTRENGKTTWYSWNFCVHASEIFSVQKLNGTDSTEICEQIL